MATHMTWMMSDAEAGGYIRIGSPDPEESSGKPVRIRLNADGQWAQKDFTPEEARTIWWALGNACDFMEAQQEDFQ